MLLLVYNFFFWHEVLGINLLIFSSVVTAFLFLLYKPDNLPSASSFHLRELSSPHHGRMNNSMTSKVVHILSLMITISFIQEGRWRSLIYSCLSVCKDFFCNARADPASPKRKSKKTAEAPCTFQNPPHEPYSALHCIHLLCDLQLRKPGLPPACFKFHRPALGARRRIVHSHFPDKNSFYPAGKFSFSRRHLQA